MNKSAIAFLVALTSVAGCSRASDEVSEKERLQNEHEDASARPEIDGGTTSVEQQRIQELADQVEQLKGELDRQRSPQAEAADWTENPGRTLCRNELPDGSIELVEGSEYPDGRQVFDGKYRRISQSGLVLVEGFYVNGQRNGAWDEWIEGGKLAKSYHMVDDVLDGEFKDYDAFSNADGMQFGQYARGKKDGVWITYFSTGDPLEIGRWGPEYEYHVTFAQHAPLTVRQYYYAHTTTTYENDEELQRIEIPESERDSYPRYVAGVTEEIKEMHRGDEASAEPASNPLSIANSPLQQASVESTDEIHRGADSQTTPAESLAFFKVSLLEERHKVLEQIRPDYRILKEEGLESLEFRSFWLVEKWKQNLSVRVSGTQRTIDKMRAEHEKEDLIAIYETEIQWYSGLSKAWSSFYQGHARGDMLSDNELKTYLDR